MIDVVIDGAEIKREADVHRVMAELLDLGPFYGGNLAALRDRLLTDVPRPVVVSWRDSAASRSALGHELFDRIVAIFEEAQSQDRNLGWTERFEFRLI